MDFRIESSQDWRDLGKKLRATAETKAIRKALTKKMQAAAKPAVDDVKDAVRTIRIRGSSGGGTRQRSLHYAKTHARGRVKAHALRATIARLVRSRMKYSGITVGLEVRVDSAQMPPGQERLPKYLDSPSGWRHPTFGNRSRWVKQTGQPWFGKTLRKHTPRVRQAAIDGVDEALKELQK